MSEYLKKVDSNWFIFCEMIVLYIILKQLQIVVMVKLTTYLLTKQIISDLNDDGFLFL